MIEGIIKINLPECIWAVRGAVTAESAESVCWFVSSSSSSSSSSFADCPRRTCLRVETSSVFVEASRRGESFSASLSSSAVYREKYIHFKFINHFCKK